MAIEGPQICIPGLVAGASLAAKQFYFVKLSAANTVVVCAAATDVPIGVLQNNPVSGGAATVCVQGVTKVSSDAAVTAGALIGTSADGQAAAYAWGTDKTKYGCGQAITSSTAGGGGGIITALINCAVPPKLVTSA